jgi:hypothetical protein
MRNTHLKAVMAAVVVAVTAAHGDAEPDAPSAASLVAALEAADWRFASAQHALPRGEVVQDEKLEVEDWREHAYGDGALRVYVSRDGGNVIAVLADASRPLYGDFREIHDTDHYSVHVAEPYVAVIPTRPVDQALFDQLRAKSWSVTELNSLVGSPSYRYHWHGVGFMFLEYAPQGLSFVDDFGIQPMYEWYYLWNREAPEPERRDVVARGLPRATSLSYESYRGHMRDVAAELATRLCEDRREVANALVGGAWSPGRRFVVAPVNVGGTFNNQQTVIAERSKPERRYYAE